VVNIIRQLVISNSPGYELLFKQVSVGSSLCGPPLNLNFVLCLQIASDKFSNASLAKSNTPPPAAGNIDSQIKVGNFAAGSAVALAI